VITVPAYFNDAERTATLHAGQLAGFNVLQIYQRTHRGGACLRPRQARLEPDRVRIRPLAAARAT